MTEPLHERRGGATAQVESTISEEIAQIHHESYGHEVLAARTVWRDELVLTVLDIELTPAERTLITNGRSEAVQQLRHEFQEAIGASFEAVVERATGRRVVAFASNTNIDPAFVSELFRLDPAPTASELAGPP